MNTLKTVVVSALGAAVLASANAAPKTFYVKPDGADDAACTEEEPGSFKAAFSKLSGNGGDSMDAMTEIIALGGTKDNPVTYTFAQSGGGTTSRVANYFHIRSSTEDPEGTIIVGGGEETPATFLVSDKPFLVSGFTFTNWVGNRSEGGGVISTMTAGRGAVSNCIFRSNTSTTYGGAINCPRVYNCQFYGNTATSGGGAVDAQYCSTDQNKWPAEIRTCVFSNNVSKAQKGGSAINTTKSMSITGCTFGNNFGGYCVSGGNASIAFTNCWFVGNDCTYTAGNLDTYLVSCSGASGFDCHFVSNVAGKCAGVWYGTWEKCDFIGNIGVKGQSSNGPSTCGVSATFRKCVFVDNVGSNATGTVLNSTCYNCAFTNNSTVVAPTGNKQDGGAMSGGSAYDCVFYGNHADGNGGTGFGTVFTRCRIENSSSSSGGAAIYAGAATNCLIVGSSGVSAISSYSHGTLSKCRPCTLVNCTVTGSKNGGINGGSQAATGYQTRIVNTISYDNVGNDIVADVLATNSLWGTVRSGKHVYGEGNFPEVAESPFKERDGNPYSLRKKSDAVDNGLPLGWTKDDVDLAGKCRWIGKGVDLGCFEYEPSIGLMLLLR